MTRKRTHHLISLISVALLGGALAASGPVTAGIAAPSLAEEPDWLAGDETEIESEPNSPGADWMFVQRRGSSTTVPGAAYRRALREARASAARTLLERPDVAAAEWENLGPTNIGGRVVDVAVDPTKDDTVYAATASGGVWRSTDAATTFKPAWPAGQTQAMGALAIARDGTIYAGTGEANPGGGSITYGGNGLYRSTDGGKSWTYLGLKDSGAIGRIAIDPKDPKRIFVAAAGNLYVPGLERGLYLTTDGGKTFKRVLKGENATTGAVDVAIDPKDGDNILVAMWDHHRVPSHRIYAGEGSGVWRSTNGGRSWQEVEIPHGLEADKVGRIGVAYAPSSPKRAYLIVASNLAGGGVGLFRSENGGAKFTKTAVEGGSLSQSSFGWWFGRLWVDPDDEDRLFIPGVNLLLSTDGGDTVAAVGSVHADQHAIAWDPKVENRVYLGNDGGMYRSDADGANGTWVAATSQGWTQHYSVDVAETDATHVVTGLQDNGCNKNWDATQLSGPDKWNSVGLCGDGLETLIQPQHGQALYVCSQYGSCTVSPAGVPAGVPLVFNSDRFGWWLPMEFDPTDPSVMYAAGNRVERSADGGLSWTTISPDLSTNPQQLDPNTGYRIRGVVTTLAPAASDANVIYAGTDDGLLWVTKDQGATWKRLKDPDLPGTWVTSVAVDPADANVAYVTYSGYRDGSAAPHVLKTSDGGASWKDVSGDLPSAPVNDVTFAGAGRVVVGTDVGVFLSDKDGRWYRVGKNMAALPILDLRWHEGSGTLTVATFGHGIQRTTL